MKGLKKKNWDDDKENVTFEPIYIGIDIDDDFQKDWTKHDITECRHWDYYSVTGANPILMLGDIADWRVNQPLDDKKYQDVISYSVVGELTKEEMSSLTYFPMKYHKKEYATEKNWNKLSEQEKQTSGLKICGEYKKFVDSRKENVQFSYITSLFTFQFLKREVRDRTVNNIKNALHPDGAFVVAEKIYSNDGETQNLYEFLNLDYKKKSFNEKEIIDKQQTLNNINNLLTERKLISYYSKYFRVSVFWKNLNFIGLLCRPKR